MALETIDINYLFGSLSTFLSITAVVAGVSFQTFIKWWDKWQDGQPIPFDRKFVGTAVAAVFGALVVAIPLQAAATERIDEFATTYGIILAWIMTAAWAYALNNGVNGVVTKLEQRGENNLMKSGKLERIIDQRVDQKLKARNEELGNTGFGARKGNVVSPDGDSGVDGSGTAADFPPPDTIVGGSDGAKNPKA